jgi:hypothetical protein
VKAFDEPEMICPGQNLVELNYIKLFLSAAKRTIEKFVQLL